MRILELLAKKRDGGELSAEELSEFIAGCVSGNLPDYQISAMLMAICIRGMTPRETAALTLAMAKSGETVDLSSIPGVKVDKHSTGGVGDKTTLIALPLAASLGAHAAKMSGRGLGFTGGTLDKLESIPGFRTDLSREEFLGVVRRVGVSVIGQSGNLDPADKKLYALRDVTGTVESLPLIASSIMSKKLASGADAILLDVKTGSGAFMKDFSDSLALAQAMVSIGAHAGRKTVALLTDMDAPLGRAAGNALEVAEACRTLQGQGPEDLTALCVTLAAELVRFSSGAPLSDCRARVQEALQSGAGFRKLCEMVKAQGGDVCALLDPSRLPQAAAQDVFTADRDGFLFHMDTQACGLAAAQLGAGREKLGDAVDPGAGLLFEKKPGAYVRKGDPLVRLYGKDAASCRAAKERLAAAIELRETPPNPRPLVFARVTADGVEKIF